MKRIIIIVLILIVIIFVLFLLLFGRYAIGLVTQTIEIKTVYETKSNISKIDRLLSVEVKINESPNWTSNYVFPITIYEYYSAPYTLQFVLRFEEKQIQKIEFKSCEIEINGIEFDILQLKDISASPDRSYIKEKYRTSSTYNPKEEEIFAKKKMIIINESENVVIEAYDINFGNLPINPSQDNNVKIKYDLSIHLIGGNIKSMKSDFVFNKEIKEMKMFSPIFNPVKK